MSLRKRIARDKRHVAFHEAGHAAIAACLGILGNDSKITVTGKGYEQGFVTLSKDGDWRKWPAHYIRKAILSTYAGPAVSFTLDPNLDLFEEGGWFEMDMIGAQNMCQWIDRTYTGLTEVPSSLRQQRVFKTRYWKQSAALVRRNWLTVEHLAGELIKRKTMMGKDVIQTLAVMPAKGGALCG